MLEIPAFRHRGQERHKSEASLPLKGERKYTQGYQTKPEFCLPGRERATVCSPATVSATVTEEISSVPLGSLHVLTQVLSP